jgi:peroxiredoxin
MSTIKVGDKLPEVSFKQFTADGLGDISTGDVFAGKRVLLFGIPGAFTPVCQGNHLPGYVEQAETFRQHGIDSIACISVNDTFVMRAFGEAKGADGRITMLADSDGEFTQKVGMEADASSFGLGRRSERYAMIVRDGVVETLQVESHFVDHAVTSAHSMLSALVTA